MKMRKGKKDSLFGSNHMLKKRASSKKGKKGLSTIKAKRQSQTLINLNLFQEITSNFPNKPIICKFRQMTL